MCGATCFGRLSAHHQKRTSALGAFVSTFERGGSSVVGRGLADHNQQRSCCTLLMMGGEAPETC